MYVMILMDYIFKLLNGLSTIKFLVFPSAHFNSEVITISSRKSQVDLQKCAKMF